MKKDLKCLQSTLFEIKTLLLSDPIIKKLLYYDTPDALEIVEVPTTQSLLVDGDGNDLNYITLYPIMEKGITEYGRNTFIMITLPLVDLDLSKTNNFYNGIAVSVITDKNHYKLNNNRLRLVELANKIIDLVDDKKFSIAGKLEVIQLEQIVFNTDVYGYTLKILGTDMGKGVDF